MKTMSPREVSKLTGVSTSTLRHYERVGLLPNVARTTSGYRRYDRDSLERVLLIQRALLIGFSLRDLRRVLAVRASGGAPCRTVRALVAERLRGLEGHIRELLGLRRELRALIADWDDRLAATPEGKRAHLLDGLGARPAIERQRLVPRTRQFPDSSRR